MLSNKSWAQEKLAIDPQYFARFAQIETLAETETIRSAWARWGRPFLHAWVYSLDDGRLRPLQTLTPRGGPISFGPNSGGSGLFRLGP